MMMTGSLFSARVVGVSNATFLEDGQLLLGWCDGGKVALGAKFCKGHTNS